MMITRIGVVNLQGEKAKPALSELCTLPHFHVAEDLGELLADPKIEGVVLLAPCCSRMDIIRLTECIRTAAENGKHVFVVADSALAAADIRQILCLTNESHVHIGIADLTIEPLVEQAHTLIAAGALGDVTYIKFHQVRCDDFLCHERALHEKMPKADHNASAVLDGRALVILNCLLGRPAAVIPTALDFAEGCMQYNTVTLIRYSDGPLCISVTSTEACADSFDMEIGGTEGSLFLKEGRCFLGTRHDGKYKTDFRDITEEERFERYPALKAWLHSFSGADDDLRRELAAIADIMQTVEDQYNEEAQA